MGNREKYGPEDQEALKNTPFVNIEYVDGDGQTVLKEEDAALPVEVKTIAGNDGKLYDFKKRITISDMENFKEGDEITIEVETAKQ